MWGVTEDSIISQGGNMASDPDHSAEGKSASESQSPNKINPVDPKGESSYIPTPDLDVS